MSVWEGVRLRFRPDCNSVSSMKPSPTEADSTIPLPLEPAIFFNKRFVAARYEEGRHEQDIFTNFLVCEELSTDDVGVARGTEFQ